MIDPSTVEKLSKLLAKQGKALITFGIVRHYSDTKFKREDPPIAEVYLVPWYPSRPVPPKVRINRVIESEFSQYYYGTIPDENHFEVRIEHLGRSIKDALLRRPKSPKEILVVLRPCNGWEQKYKTCVYKKLFGAKRYKENVSFEPK